MMLNYGVSALKKTVDDGYLCSVVSHEELVTSTKNKFKDISGTAVLIRLRDLKTPDSVSLLLGIQYICCCYKI